MTTHDRIFLAFLIAVALNILQAIWGISAAAKFEPSIQYVTLDGGYTVAWNEKGNPVIDNTEFVPARLRAVVKQFITTRYAYDHQNIQKINSGLALMSEEARVQENDNLRRINLPVTVIAPRLKVDLEPDLQNMKVQPLGNGQFEVLVEGQARINDAIRYTDPRQPLQKPFSVQFTVQAVKSSDINPLGYQVISTGRENIL